MKALVYGGPGSKSWETVDDPGIQDSSDAVVRILTTTICGTDLHILHGDVASCEPGTIFGHEGVAEVVEVGAGVKNFAKGDRVIVSCITKCGSCSFCQAGHPDHCQSNDAGIGWILGHRINGTLAEYVRIPHADFSMHKVPEGVTDEQAVFLSDSLPTGFEVGVIAGGVKPGDVVAVVGTGAVGLASVLTAGLYGASRVIGIDTNDFRLRKAKEFGATDTFNANDKDLKEKVFALTDGLGVDVAIEAVGYPETLQRAISLARPRGRVANIGVHGTPVEFPMEALWIQNLNVSMGLVDATSTATLLKMVASGRIASEKMGTHTFTLNDIDNAWDTFQNATKEEALKVVLKA
ncbi:MAG: alcohol dehydrogenase catalytic domain-containing protein [Thermoleophilia bacterium]|nr:alcohol dehydrogenase catalytic domain-containing protein [Thermoleophilia bacterium]